MCNDLGSLALLGILNNNWETGLSSDLLVKVYVIFETEDAGSRYLKFIKLTV